MSFECLNQKYLGPHSHLLYMFRLWFSVDSFPVVFTDYLKLQEKEKKKNKTLTIPDAFTIPSVKHLKSKFQDSLWLIASWATGLHTIQQTVKWSGSEKEGCTY